MGGEPEVVQREAQLTHHLQQSDGAMRINTQNRAAYSDPIPIFVRIITKLQYYSIRVRIDMALLDLDPKPVAIKTTIFEFLHRPTDTQICFYTSVIMFFRI